MTENPLNEKLKGYRVLLASGSPRRQELLKELGVSFEQVKNEVEETYPQHLEGAEISDHLALLKAKALQPALRERDILITADTVVWHKGISLAKPADVKEAVQMLNTLSNEMHQVITSVCFTTQKKQLVQHCTTEVRFRKLQPQEIQYYAESYRPVDKAGAYGIQEWLGNIGIDEIRGSYTNVVGMPTHLVYKTLMDMVS